MSSFGFSQTPQALMCKSIALIQTMILAAQDFGLGTLWICDIFYSEREICSWLNRSDELVAAVAIGYANQSPNAQPRKSWRDVTEWENLNF